MFSTNNSFDISVSIIVKKSVLVVPTFLCLVTVNFFIDTRLFVCLFQKRLGASQIILPNALEYRSAYALVGFSGPPEIAKDLNWIREELSEPSRGPSVISIQLEAGK